MNFVVFFFFEEIRIGSCSSDSEWPKLGRENKNGETFKNAFKNQHSDNNDAAAKIIIMSVKMIMQEQEEIP